MKLKTLLAPALVLFAFGLAACGSSGDDSSGSTAASESTATTAEPSGNAPAPSGEAVRAAKVKIIEFVYGPDPVTVQVGGKVIWQNEDTAPHTATADDGSFDTGTIERGKIKSETFKQAGTFTYFCDIHPTMHGTVKVVEKD
jgi:plastocyanin